MQMEKIGFYTLSDNRVRNVSAQSPLWRCELILTDACNFKCPYCRGVKPEYKGTLPYRDAFNTLYLWHKQGLKNVRFSGGEPTLYPGLEALVAQCKHDGVEHIALSTNGSAPLDVYDELILHGVNDFSISLDACCASTGDAMAGVPNTWQRVVTAIKHIASKGVYTTVGVVLTDKNVSELPKTVRFAHDLGVSDIRIISAAQYNAMLEGVKDLPQELLDAHPILRYRVNNILAGRNVRGIQAHDSNRCALVLDDMAVLKGHHFPCIIYLREGGAPIGKVGPDMRAEREAWFKTHDTHCDPICQKNCLDVCVDYNNRYRALRKP